MIKAVLFDFDGVLTTDATGSQSTCNYISKQSNVDLEKFRSAYYEYNVDLLSGKLTHDLIWDRLCESIETSIDKRLLYESFIHTPIDLKMIQMIKALRKAEYKIGMVTDNKKDRMDAIITYHDWNTLLDAVAVSAEVGSGKDESFIFNNVLSQLNLCAQECVFIDNQKKNLIVPKALGMAVIYFDHDERDHGELVKALNELRVRIELAIN